MPVDFPPASLKPLVAEVASLLTERKETVSVAETAAGGLLSAALLSVPGASAYYAGGLTLYTLASRIAFANWTPDTVKEYRGPSPQIVKGLAEDVRSKLDSTYTICESGTAGPGIRPGAEGVRNKQPGYVALAVARSSGPTVTREVESGLGENDREGNMVEFAAAGLQLLLDVLRAEGSRL